MNLKLSGLDSSRSQRVLPILGLTIIAALLALSGGAYSQAPAIRARPIDFALKDAIRGSELVLKSPATVLIGEIHGTLETPILVASLVRSARIERVPTILCVEISSAEQRALDRFLQSDGREPAVAALLAGPHWSGDDGRASVGMFAMIELMRRLNQQGEDVRVVAMDINVEVPNVDPKLITPKELERIEAQVESRDRAMAEAVLAARRQFPKSNVVVLAGNVHARMRKGVPWDEQYAPMGWHIAQALPGAISLNVEFSGGEAWVATDKGVGPSRMRGVDRGNDPFIELFAKPQDGYHGTFYVGKISAARPVHDPKDRGEGERKK